jgi:uncharacterized protein
VLVEFRVANHRSLRDEQVLTMEAGRVGDETDPRPRQVPGYPERLLTVAGLYGANASGKSNVLAALAFMREAVLQSHRFWSPAEEEPARPLARRAPTASNVGTSGQADEQSLLPRDPFAWGPKKNDPSLFEVTFLLDQVRCQYGFQASDDRFLEEWLFAWPAGKKQLWFERDEHAFRFGENLKGENKLIEKVTRPNALFVSAAAQHNHPYLSPIFAWFQSLEVINIREGRYAHQLPFQMASEFALARLLEKDGSQRTLFQEEEHPEGLLEHFRDFLKQADTGVVDLRAERSGSDEKPRRIGARFFLKHKSESDDTWLPLREESNGTRTLFYMALPILRVLQRGGLLLIDELERSLHPTLARKIVDRFNDPGANPKSSQIIFTTHDTNLLGTVLGKPALRRDQVWLTEKDAEGATVLYPLTDYKPRKNENLERGYLQGRYGAIPFLNDFLVKAE